MKSQRSATSSRNARRTGSPCRNRMQVQSTNGFGESMCRRREGSNRCSANCRRRETRHESLRQAADRLQAHLEHSLAAPDTIPAADLAAFVSALALTEIALARKPENGEFHKESSTAAEPTQHLPLAESVVDYPANDEESRIQELATGDFLWRRELENLWRKHITKDEFHRPVVRSLGLPVLVIVDHVRAGRSWKSICENYPGLLWDDIRAAVSMATECGWLEQD
jgi:uncharacterized protein (DUF433 family)